MRYKHVKLPESGDKITIENNGLKVSDHPILGYVEGDGIGPDITKASLRVWEAAVPINPVTILTTLGVMLALLRRIDSDREVTSWRFS